MNPVKNLVRDLVERRLWPVALLLVVAAVAVPVYLSRSSNDSNSDQPLPAQTAQVGGKASKAVVTLDETTDESDGVGKASNPFKQQHVPKTDQAADTSSKPSDKSSSSNDTTSSGGASPSGGTSPSGDSTPSGGSTPSGSGPSDETKPKADITHVSLHLGQIGQLKTYANVARLSALPSPGQPLFVFTGVLKDGKTAVLLPNSTVQIGDESDVSCKPSNTSCQKLEVQQDDTIFFKLAGDASGAEYQLDVVTVHLKKGESAKAAAAALGRHSKAGAAMLRDAHVYGSSEYQGADDYRFMPDTGLLERVPEHGTGATAASAGDAAAALPGVPVWHWRDDS
jgi:hypothetical protein